MSTSARKRLIALSAVLPILAAGALGYIDAKKQPMGKDAAEEPYILVQPSVGNLPQTIPVTLVQSGDDITAATFTLTDPRIKSGMRITLYAEKGRALAEEGRVISVGTEQGTAHLPALPDKPVRGNIIIAENAWARRIPSDALVGNILWKAAPAPDGTFRAYKAIIDNPLSSQGYIDAAPYMETGEYAIMNPAPGMEDGMPLADMIFSENTPPSFQPAIKVLQASNEQKTIALISRIEMFPPEGEVLTESEDAACNAPTPP